MAGRPGVDGYGLTYLFGDGWVKLADTRQSLILVDTPRPPLRRVTRLRLSGTG